MLRHLITSWNLKILNFKIWFSWERKELLKWNKKYFLLVWQVYSFRPWKQISKNVADTTFKFSFKPDQYVACMYNGHWWIEFIVTVDVCNSDLDFSFKHPHGPTQLFSCPKQEDRCLLPFIWCIRGQ